VQAVCSRNARLVDEVEAGQDRNGAEGEEQEAGDRHGNGDQVVHAREEGERGAGAKRLRDAGCRRQERRWWAGCIG